MCIGVKYRIVFSPKVLIIFEFTNKNQSIFVAQKCIKYIKGVLWVGESRMTIMS